MYFTPFVSVIAIWTILPHVAVAAQLQSHAAGVRLISTHVFHVALLLQVGKALIDAGFRVLTGGLSGVMAAAMRGARASSKYEEGDTIAILPGDDPSAANAYADVVICTGMGEYRNGIVGRADALVAIGGAEGTVVEMLTAWGRVKPYRPIVVLTGVSGESIRFAGGRVGTRGGPQRQGIMGAGTVGEAVQMLRAALGL